MDLPLLSIGLLEDFPSLSVGLLGDFPYLIIGSLGDYLSPGVRDSLRTFRCCVGKDFGALLSIQECRIS